MVVINIVNLADLGGTTGRRIDAEYYDPYSVNLERKLKKIFYRKLSNFGLKVDVSAFYPSIAESYQHEGIPFIRVSDVMEGFLKDEEMVFLPPEVVNKFSSIRKAHPYDIIITKGGTVGITTILPSKFPVYALSRDVILIKSSVLSKEKAISIMLFLISKYGKFQLLRGKSQQVQPHLTLPLVRGLLLPHFEVKDAIKDYEKSFCYFELSKSLYSQAEKLLLEELGLKDFKPKYELSYTANLFQAFVVHRIDAEYFQPVYHQLIKHLKNSLEVKPLKTFILDFQKGIEVGSENYQEEGKPFIRVSNLSIHGFVERDQKYIDDELYQTLKDIYEPKVGDFLLTKDATPGIAYVVKEPVEGVIASGILKLKIDEEKIDKEYLALCINSLVGKLQIERDGGGSVIIHWKPEQIKNLQIPILPPETQQRIAELVKQSHEARRKAKGLLEEAKRKVEEAVENEIKNN